MLSRRVTSRIELVGAPRFDLRAGGAVAVMAGLAGDGVGGFMNTLGIQLFKRSRSLEMEVRCSRWNILQHTRGS